MNLKHIASAKMLLSHWSPSKLNNLLEETDIEMSRALDYVSPNNIKVSCVQLALRNELPAKECLDLIISNVNSAVRDGSQLIVFPEYIGLLPLLSSSSLFDLCYQFSEDLINSAQEPVEQALQFYNKYLAQPLYESYVRFFSLLAIKASVYILAGTTIVRTREGLYNRAFLFDPDGNIILQQDKLHLSPFEKLCGILPGKGIHAAQTKLCRVSVLTGLDQRIFEAARAAHTLGAQLLLCPSAFSSSRSSAFFQSCAFMRCQEQPVFAVSAWLTGDFMDLPFRAISGIYAPFGQQAGQRHHHADRAPRRQRLPDRPHRPGTTQPGPRPVYLGHQPRRRGDGPAGIWPCPPDPGGGGQRRRGGERRRPTAANGGGSRDRRGHGRSLRERHPPRAGLAC